MSLAGERLAPRRVGTNGQLPVRPPGPRRGFESWPGRRFAAPDRQTPDYRLLLPRARARRTFTSSGNATSGPSQRRSIARMAAENGSPDSE